MITTVERIGIASTCEVGGANGPEHFKSVDKEVYYVFRINGWEANNPTDDAAGHDLAGRMGIIGSVIADDKITATEITSLVQALTGRHGGSEHIPAVEEALLATLGDRRVDLSDGLDLARVLATVAGGPGVGNFAGVARSIISGLFHI